MKKLMFLPFLVFVTVTNAQIQIGLKAGVNISNFTGGNFHDIETNSLVAFHGGGFLHIRLGTHLVLQPELLFSSQGARLTNAGVDSNFKISYLNVPIVLQYETDGGFYVEAGPQFGVKLSEDIPNTTIGDFAKGTDFSIDFGLGFHSKSGFGIGGRYTLGVSKVGEFDSANFDPDFSNGVIQFSLFYVFGSKKKSK